MGTVTNISDRKAKLIVRGGPSDGAAINDYLIPEDVAERIALGDFSIRNLPQAAIEGIVRDWMKVAERSQ